MRQASGWLVQLLPEGFGGPKKIIPCGMRLVKEGKKEVGKEERKGI